MRCDWHLSGLTIGGDYLPDNKFRPNDVTSLLHAVCSKFSSLQVLEIISPPVLYKLPANIGQLSQLKMFRTDSANFTALPTSFGQLSSLEQLGVYDVYMLDISPKPWTIEGLAPVQQLTQLKRFDLGISLVLQPFFSDWLGSCHFPVLEGLTLRGGIPSCIGNFSSLTYLIIQENTTYEVPEGIGYLRLLKLLWLLGNAVSLPTSFSRLTDLEDLDVTTDMQNFALIEHFTKLTELDFFDNWADQVIPYPEFLWTFISLKKLHLWGSCVPSLPDALGNLKNLECLRLRGHVDLQLLPETFGNLFSLLELRIEDCSSLLKLPESIGNLKLLRELRICDCFQLTTLAESLGQLQRLEKLFLENVESLERLPSSIGKLRALKELIMRDTGEVFLPETFADLVLDKPIEECFLELVYFDGSTKVVMVGPRVTLAVALLEEHRECNFENGF